MTRQFYTATDGGLLPSEQVLERYKRSHMWLRRIRGRDPENPHLFDPNFPKPAMRHNGRDYWKLADLQQWEALNVETS